MKKYELIFEDHFDDDKLDESKWNYEVGNHQWPNKEAQAYSNKSSNIFVKDSNLHIRGLKEKDGEREYTSSKINTRGKFFFTYGKVEIRAKLPTAHGAWPAFWLMPNERKEGVWWPECGEIDMMEFIPHHKRNPEHGILFYSLHSKLHNHRNKDQVQRTITIPLDIDLGADYHLYEMEWDEEKFVYYFDGKEVARFSRFDDKENQGFESWPFDYDYYLIINIALGGGLGGEIHDEDLPTEMLIDYVKVYK